MPRLGGVAALLLLPAAAAGCICEGDCAWGLGGCVVASTVSLSTDLGHHLAATLGPGPEWLSRLPGVPAAALGHALAWALERLRHSGAVDAAHSGLAAASSALPTGHALRGVVAASLEAMETWRGGFVEAFPRHAAAVPGRAALLCSVLWVGLAALVASWFAARLLRGLFCARRGESDVMFFPDRSGRHLARVCQELASARRRLWLAIFVLTDDTLSAEVLRAHTRGLDVRIIADDEQTNMLGSDVQRLADAGVPVLLDNSTARMHHKFVVLDDIVMSGSFNWTKQASIANNENLCIMRDSGAVQAFAGEFRRLWGEFRRRGRRPGRSSPHQERSRGRGRHHTPPAR